MWPWNNLKTIISQTLDKYTPDNDDNLENLRISFNLTVIAKLSGLHGYSKYTKEVVGEIEKYRDKGIM